MDTKTVKEVSNPQTPRHTWADVVREIGETWTFHTVLDDEDGKERVWASDQGGFIMTREEMTSFVEKMTLFFDDCPGCAEESNKRRWDEVEHHGH
jgi:hypothetical protein